MIVSLSDQTLTAYRSEFAYLFQSAKIGLIYYRNCGRTFRNNARDKSSSLAFLVLNVKRNILLVTNTGNDLKSMVAEAAKKTG